MKKLYFVLLVVSLVSSRVSAEELIWGSCTTYAPMPVLFIHGINANCKTWDTAIPELQKYFGYRETILNDHLKKISSYPERKGVTYFKDEETNYESPAKLYLEAYDYGGKDSEESLKSTSFYQEELKEIIEGDPKNPAKPGLLKSYYGENYNPETDKLIIVGYSQGGLIAREYVQRNPEQAKNVKRLITIGTPHYGSDGLAVLAGGYYI